MLEVIAFVEDHRLVTVPPIARADWQMFMKSLDCQSAESLLSRRREYHRVIWLTRWITKPGWWECKYYPFLVRHGLPWDDTRPSLATAHDCEVQTLLPFVRYSVLDWRGLALGVYYLMERRSGWKHPSKSDWNVTLAAISMRPDHIP
jgi:hypothetical protein